MTTTSTEKNGATTSRRTSTTRRALREVINNIDNKEIEDNDHFDNNSEWEKTINKFIFVNFFKIGYSAIACDGRHQCQGNTSTFSTGHL